MFSGRLHLTVNFDLFLLMVPNIVVLIVIFPNVPT